MKQLNTKEIAATSGGIDPILFTMGAGFGICVALNYAKTEYNGTCKKKENQSACFFMNNVEPCTKDFLLPAVSYITGLIMGRRNSQQQHQHRLHHPHKHKH
jgi:hypothetical protein